MQMTRLYLMHTWLFWLLNIWHNLVEQGSILRATDMCNL